MNHGRNTEGNDLPKIETDSFRVWMGHLHMDGDAVRGSIYCDIKDSNSDPLFEDNVKISQQNIQSFVNTVGRVEDIDSDIEDKVFRELYKLKHEAREIALKESSDVEHSEEAEELDVDPEEIEKIFELSYLLCLAQKTDKIHVGNYILKAVSAISALSKNATDMALNLWSVGSSGAGKTHCFQTIFKTIPAEYKTKFNSCSPKALYYFTEKYGPDVLKGKVLMFNEAEASEEAADILRSITDPNEENPSHLTVQDQNSMEIEIEGSPVTWFTSVDPLDDGQLQNRFLFSNPDEGSQHKAEIAEHQMDSYQDGVLQPIKEEGFPELKAAYREIVEKTKDLDVVVPFRWEWRRKENARLQDYFANMVFTLAKIHFQDRPIIDGKIVVTKQDYYVAKLLWNRIEEVTLEKAREKDLELLDFIDEDNPVTRRELVEDSGMSYGVIREAVDRLREADLVKGEQEPDKTWKYTKVGSSKVVQTAVELEKDSLTAESLEDALEQKTEVAEEEVIDEGVVSQVRNLSPSVWNKLCSIFEVGSEELDKILEGEEDFKQTVTTATTREDAENSTENISEKKPDTYSDGMPKDEIGKRIWNMTKGGEVAQQFIISDIKNDPEMSYDKQEIMDYMVESPAFRLNSKEKTVERNHSEGQ